MKKVKHSHVDFFDHQPTKAEKIKMTNIQKTPSEWLKLLCPDWASENSDIAASANSILLDYKPYSKGRLSSRLLCRLSVQEYSKAKNSEYPNANLWKTLGIQDDFDRAYIISQIERFSFHYSINVFFTEDDLYDVVLGATATATTENSGLSLKPVTSIVSVSNCSENSGVEATVSKDTCITTKSAEKIQDTVIGRKVMKREQLKLSFQHRQAKLHEREVVNAQKIAQKSLRATSREEKRQKKVIQRKLREKSVLEQKDAALRRAAELVQSNRVPIEITRGAVAAQAAANAAVAMMGVMKCPKEEVSAPIKKTRSAIVVSTASDLNQIVTHSKNLFAKYNAIAKEHNQKVNWITVAKELGIHVKVREKYARMHGRALCRGFDFEKYGHYRIKEHPHIFLNPLTAEQKSKLQPKTQDPSTDLMNDNKQINHTVYNIRVSATAVNAATKAAAVLQSVSNVDDTTVAVKVRDVSVKVNSDGNDDPGQPVGLIITNTTSPLATVTV